MGGEVVRTWSGVTALDDAEPYLRHLREDTLPHLQSLSGFCGVEVLRRALGQDEVEFVVQTRWSDLEAIHAFAGDALHVAVVPAAARARLRRFDERVEHYEVAVCG